MDSKLCDILLESRYEGNISQAKLADEIGVNKKTIMNWEQGISQPTIESIIKWFEACGVNPMHYMLEYMSPGAFDDVDYKTEQKINDAFNSLTELMSCEDKMALLYIYFGQHGSSPESVMQMLLAHLHNPLKDRISIAVHIATGYRLNESLDALVGGDLPKPNLDLLDEAILKAAESVKNCKAGYVVKGTKTE